MKKFVKVLLIFMLIPSILLGCNEVKNEGGTDSTNNNNEVTIESNKTNSTEKENTTTSKIEQKDARLFFYDGVTDKIVYKDTKIEVKEKAVVTALVNSLKKSLIQGVDPLLSEDVAVKSAKVDNDEKTLYVDFKSKIIDPQKVGSGPESGILKSLVNTLGYYYKVDKVILTINGEPYESGHIIMKKGEAFKVDLSNTIEG